VKTFPNISPAAVGAIIQHAARRVAAPGTVIFTEGDVSSDMIFLYSGCLDVHIRGQQKATIDSSNIVGHHAYLYHRPRSATVVVKSGPPCVYYAFSIDTLANDVDIKSGLWHNTNAAARVVSAKPSERNQAMDAEHPQGANGGVGAVGAADIIVAGRETDHLSPLSKRRMSALLGEEASFRRYSRDVLDYEDKPSNHVSEPSGRLSPVESNEQWLAHADSTLHPRDYETLRPASAAHARSDRLGASSLSLHQPASSRPKTSLPSKSTAPSTHAYGTPQFLSPRQPAAASARLRSSPATPSPNRRLSIVARMKEAVQEQLSSSSCAAVSCIIFSAAWLLCLTQLEKSRVPESRHSVCRCVRRLLCFDLWAGLTGFPGSWLCLHCMMMQPSSTSRHVT
jgi:hypothetical protein